MTRYQICDQVRVISDPSCIPGKIIEVQPERDSPNYWYRVEFISAEASSLRTRWFMHDQLVLLSEEYQGYGEF